MKSNKLKHNYKTLFNRALCEGKGLLNVFSLSNKLLLLSYSLA